MSEVQDNRRMDSPESSGPEVHGANSLRTTKEPSKRKRKEATQPNNAEFFVVVAPIYTKYILPIRPSPKL